MLYTGPLYEKFVAPAQLPELLRNLIVEEILFQNNWK